MVTHWALSSLAAGDRLSRVPQQPGLINWVLGDSGVARFKIVASLCAVVEGAFKGV
jgi:hypothetical protein